MNQENEETNINIKEIRTDDKVSEKDKTKTIAQTIISYKSTLTINDPVTKASDNSKQQQATGRRVFVSAYISNALEMYDFIITGTLIPYMFHLYFPFKDRLSVLMAGSLTYLIGFLMRPLGAIFFGHFGDVVGRKKALLSSIFGMAALTFCIGILPTYHQIGVCAPVLLILLRCLQGFCLGGEGQGANVLVLEHFQGKRPGLIGAMLATSNGMAALLSFAVGMMVTSNLVPGQPDQSETWRWCYILGASLALVGLYLRTHAPETAFPERVPKGQSRFPIARLFREHKMSLLAVFLIVGIAAALTQTQFTFTNMFMTQFLHFTSQKAFRFSMISTIIGMISVIIAGHFCDRFGLMKSVKVALAICCIFILPAHYLMAAGQTVQVALGLLLITLCGAGVAGIAPHFVASAFPRSERYTGAAFGNNLAQAMMGGVQPAIALYLIHKTEILWSPGLYTVGIAGLCLIFICLRGQNMIPFSYHK